MKRTPGRKRTPRLRRMAHTAAAVWLALALAACEERLEPEYRTVEERRGHAGFAGERDGAEELAIDTDAILAMGYERRPVTPEAEAMETPAPDAEREADRQALEERTQGWDYIASRMMFGNWTGKIELDRDGETVAVNAGDVIRDVTIIDVNNKHVLLAYGNATRELPWNAERVARQRERAAEMDIVRAGLERARRQLKQLPVPEVTEDMSFQQRKQIDTMKRVSNVLEALSENLEQYEVEPQHVDTLMMAAEMQYSTLRASIGNETAY